MSFYSEDDLNDMEQWAVYSFGPRGTPVLRLEDTEIHLSPGTFPRFTLGPHREFILIIPGGEVLIFRLRGLSCRIQSAYEF